MLCKDVRTVETFKDRLRQAATYAGVEFGQTAIARALGINKQTVDRWFKDSEPRPAMIYHIADTWRINARWLAIGDGDMIPGPNGGGLAKPEREIIQSYRSLDHKGQASLRVMAKALVRVVVVAALTFPIYPAIQKSEAAVYYVKSWLRRFWTEIVRKRTEFCHTEQSLGTHRVASS